MPRMYRGRAWLGRAFSGLMFRGPVPARPDPATVPRTAVNQQPGGGSLYPFVVRGSLPGQVLDLYLSYEDDARAHRLPFTLTISDTLYTVTDADSGVVASHDIVDATGTTVWGLRTVYEWTASDHVLRVVVRPDMAGNGTGVLDPRTCDRLPARVRSLRVGVDTIAGSVRFEAGYNVVLAPIQTQRVDGGRRVDQIGFDVTAGAGAGRAPGCTAADGIVRQINGVSADCAGNFVIETDPCFRLGAPSANTMRLVSDCRPCCPCTLYVDTYAGLRRLWNRWKADAAAAEAVRDGYNANRARWLAGLDCRLANLGRLVVQGEASCATFVGGSFANRTACCLAPVEIRFTVRKFNGGSASPWTGTIKSATLDASTTDGPEKYVPLVTGQVIHFFADYADPQATTAAKMRLCTDACAAGQSLEITMTVHVPDPPVGCTLPTVTVPPAVIALWGATDLSQVRAVEVKTVPLDPKPPAPDCGCTT